MPSFSRRSFGLAAIAATTTVGAYLVYNQIKKKKKKTKLGGDGSSSFDIFTKPELQRTVSECTEATLDSKDIEEVCNSKGDVDLKIFRQLLEQKKQSNHCSSKVTLFSHLLTKLEQTLDERDRIEDKLDHLRDSPAARPSISKLPNPPDNKSPPVAVPLSDTSVCMVVQRYRGATIMCNDNETIRVGKSGASPKAAASSQAYCGLMVYVSFAKGCNQSAVKAAAKIIVNLPVLTVGEWGDGNKTMNVVDLAKQHPNAASVVIVPQASLINKVKSQGRSLQYHGQIGREEGNTLYHYFVNTVRGLVLESQCQARKEPLPEWYQKSCSAQSGSSHQKASPSIPPEDLFRDETLYSKFDENTGIPLADAEGEPITKSAQKKMRKAQAAHRVRHLKYLRENRGNDDAASVATASTTSTSASSSSKKHWANAIDPSFVQVVAGTFGKRQSLEFVADMGPFCHVVQV